MWNELIEEYDPDKILRSPQNKTQKYSKQENQSEEDAKEK